MTSPSFPSQTDGAYSVQYDPLDDQQLSVTIADAVATYCGQDVTALDPLHYAVDTDALERLFEPRTNAVRTDGSVTFEYNDCLVAVAADGEIRITAA